MLSAKPKLPFNESLQPFQEQEDDALNKDIIVSVRSDAVRDPTYARVLADYQAALQRYIEEDRWKTYPFLASIETYSKCNAACDFCPYPQLGRKGELLSELLFEKIISDLADSNPLGPAMMMLSRVNEPFLDKRLFEFIQHIERQFPNVWMNHVSNGSPLNEANFDRLLASKRTSLLKISFNDHRQDRYEAVMKINYQNTLKNLRMIHAKKVAGEFWFPVRIGRVGDGSSDDLAFLGWVKREFPAFEPQVSPRFDWRGKVGSSTYEVPDLGCAQWFQLHLLANGRDAFCCTDSEGEAGIGNAKTHHVVHDIYNSSERLALRTNPGSRLGIRKCMSCAALA